MIILEKVIVCAFDQETTARSSILFEGYCLHLLNKINDTYQ